MSGEFPANAVSFLGRPGFLGNPRKKGLSGPPVAFVQLARTDSITTAVSIRAGATASDASNTLWVSANTAGNFLIGYMSYAQSAPDTPVITDTLGNTWFIDPVGSLWHTGTGGGYGSGFHVIYCPNCKAGVNSVTVTFGAGTQTFRSLVLSEYSGVTRVGPLIASAAVQMTGTVAVDSFSSGNTSALPLQPALVYGAYINVDATTNPAPAAGTGYISRGGHTLWNNPVFFGASEDKRVTSQAAVAATFTGAAGRAMVYCGAFSEGN